ncbi:YhdP family protein [Montanilutibacter psychrotolerans]|uniref:TIGR02099 family protein n=1 Tax=Montanilutibacter psychrotolerans TaxID=1327343 RepID=A0A3M8T3U1_9GAMM|nr:YhdP family protein [Lysobacter psychrotolerans]RNF86356.1 TIGR02099 family protein [Lysobacter psychrotolerans]
MPTPVRRRLRLARRGLGYAVAVMLVLVAVLLGIASRLLPLAESHPEQIAAWLSERAGRTVAFDRVETEWTRRGPLLRLDGLRVGDGEKAFTIGDTEMLVSLYAGLLPGHSFSELRLRGLDLTLERLDDGRWQVRGLPGQQQKGGDPFAALEGLGELQVIGGKLAVVAPALDIDTHIPRIDVRLRVDGHRVRAGVRAWPRGDARPVDAMLDLDRKRGDGRAYAGARDADLATWTALPRLAGVSVVSGTGRAEAWAQLRGHRVATLTVDAQLEDVALRAATPIAGKLGEVRFPRVQARSRWQTVSGGWRVDAPTLRIGEGAQQQVLDGLALAGGQRYALRADRIDAGPLLAVAALSDRLPDGLRGWLQATRPDVQLQRIELAGHRSGAMHASARIDALSFASVGDAPGLSGLAGDIDGDANGFSLKLDPQAAFRFDWPSGFGVPHPARLDGTVTGWREGAGWRIATPSLRIDGGSFGARARGGLWWQGDGSRPWIDIAAEIDKTHLPVAKGFWIRHRMPPKVVEWLDRALVDGYVQNGRALVSGDLDDWPFRDRNGRFEATAHIGAATLKFQPDWPAVEGVEADASFIADGFTVVGKATGSVGRLGEVAISELTAGIDHYNDGTLTVQAKGAGDAAQLLTVLRQSPLQADHAQTLDNLTASGAANVGFAMALPLKRGGQLAIDGSVDLHDAKLADARWKLAFDQVTGHAAYSRGGFGAEHLQVRHEGQPGRLSLRAGDAYVRESGHVFEAGLEASIDADGLIDRAPDLAWLKPHLDGRSPWTVGVAIAKAPPGQTAPATLQLRSNLVGTALDLPAPLRKPAGASLLATVETPLPVGSGDVRVALGKLMAVRARSNAGKTGVRVQLGADRVDDAPPLSGLIATGRTESLDALEWITLTRGGGNGGGLPLQRIDVRADRLNLLGGVFADSRVVVVPANGGTAVRAEGASLAGALMVPDDTRNAPIAGRFQRLHWRSATAATTSNAATGASVPLSAAPSVPVTAGDDGFDPAAIPALAFDIDELRIGAATLGSARLRTRPDGNGMRIEQLQTRAPGQRIDGTGLWTGRGAGARTRLDLALASEDFGALLDGFGVGGRLAGGNGTVRFDASWPGSPAGFSLAALDGRMVVDARDGRLLEVEPGAGRVLGLLSLAELPRRLTLDFRDFFNKGFAFNRIGGNVRFAGGSASSSDLRIDGPAAAIDIRGSANLRAQSFDQTIEVRPKAGNLLTAVGAIAGGPVGAAIGAAANAVLNKPMGRLAAKTYRVTGPWKEPKVEVVGREQGRAAARPAGPPSG